MKKFKMTTGKWIFLITSIIIVVLILNKAFEKEKGTYVEYTTLKKGSIVETIPATGKIRPVTEVKISPDVSGEIIELNKEEGDYVKKGELIIKIKQDVYLSIRDQAMASLKSTEASYLQQKAQLHSDSLSYMRNLSLFNKGAIPQSEFETSYAQYQISIERVKSALYNIQSSTAALNEANENLTKTTIYAPISGIISSLSVEQGERVVGTSQMAGTEMLRIADFEEMEVLVDVSENDIIRLSHCDTAKIKVDAYPDRTFTGIVTQIANSANNDGSSSENITSFEVSISILAESYADLSKISSLPFRPGMSASVDIQTQRKDDIYILPIECVTARADLQEADSTAVKNDIINEYVFIIKGENAELKRVRTGIQDFSYIEIIEGLDESMEIIKAPYEAISKTLRDGSLISKQVI